MSHINVLPLDNKRVKLTMNFGNKKEVTTLPQKMVHRYIRRSIVSAINRYINHRYEIMRYYNGYCSDAKMQALLRLRTKMGTAEKWTILAAAKHILAMKDDLAALLPGGSSKFFRNNQRLLEDLTAWATKFVNEHTSYYKQNAA